MKITKVCVVHSNNTGMPKTIIKEFSKEFAQGVPRQNLREIQERQQPKNVLTELPMELLWAPTELQKIFVKNFPMKYSGKFSKKILKQELLKQCEKYYLSYFQRKFLGNLSRN